jgi:D-3-phosphoglycerate dehydrogenase
MKGDAPLVKTAPADPVQEAALRHVFEQRCLGGAALGVYWAEPLPADHWLLAPDNVLLIPHLDYASTKNPCACYRNVLRHIQDGLAGASVPPMRTHLP